MEMRGHHLKHIRRFKSVGEYGIPRISPVDIAVDSFIPFNYAKSDEQPEKKGVHFFVDDSQFERVWNQPERYIQVLRRFSCVCSPDFSVYADFSKAVQIYNHYRKHVLAALWQESGLSVIPTIAWSTPDSYEWCFDGEPKKSIVAVNSVGTQRKPWTKEAFLHGYNAMLEHLKPEKILFWGKVPEGVQGNVVPMESFIDQMERRKEERGCGR